MRVLGSLLLALASLAAAQDFDNANVSKQKLGYQSDVSRLRNIVINSLYSKRDVFLRELISNANDAIEKLRLTALTDKSVWDGSPLNITIKAERDATGKGGRIIISDTGIGMSADEMTRNLGTLAKSGTSEFLSQAEKTDSTGQGNLIGAFGLGFYSSFLVADQVYVASIPPATAQNPNPVQNVFSSASDANDFEIFVDPRGNTLGRGTEITLHLKPDALEFLDTLKLSELVTKHSSFSSAFPIYLWTESTKEVPVEEETSAAEETSPADESSPAEKTTPTEPGEDEEAVVEEEKETKAEVKAEDEKPKTKTVTVEEWIQTNPQPPLWMRDPKKVTDEEYKAFYQATFKDHQDPLAWYHFTGDSGSGTSFRAMIFVPNRLSEEYWQNPLLSNNKDFRLMVKRVFITSDLGENFLPKWANWVKVIVDADDLPLNVSRETLQSTKFLAQIKTIILRRLIQLFTRIQDDEPRRYDDLLHVYNGVLKLGAVEDKKNSNKIVPLVRFPSTERKAISLDQYLENKKQGQKQIFYLADMGKDVEVLRKSVFVEKLHARGYEVALLTEPLDEILVQTLRHYKGLQFQDVAKTGLKFGDEDDDPDSSPERQEALKEQYKPLTDFIKAEAGNLVRDVVISNRLVTSPVAIVADMMGYTANIEKMLNAQNKRKESDILYDFGKRQRMLEINPRSPLIEGLLRRVEQLPTEEDEKDVEAEEELKEVVSILIDGALVRSGFEVSDSNAFFTRVDRVLRRSLGVSESAQADASVKPAPPVEPHVEEEDTKEKPSIQLPDHMKDKVQMEMEEIDENDLPVDFDPHAQLHDEL